MRARTEARIRAEEVDEAREVARRAEERAVGMVMSNACPDCGVAVQPKLRCVGCEFKAHASAHAAMQRHGASTLSPARQQAEAREMKIAPGRWNNSPPPSPPRSPTRSPHTAAHHVSPSKRRLEMSGHTMSDTWG